MERTEEQKVAQSPLTVVLGGSEYEIKPLTVKYALPWCRKLVTHFKDSQSLLKTTSDNNEGFSTAFTGILSDKPEQMFDLFFEYAHNLDRNEIEEIASTAEIIVAFEGVCAIESPFLSLAIKAMTKTMTNISQ